MGQIKIKASKVFVLDNALYELEEQQTKFPLNVGYAVHKMSKQISEISEYISNRLFAVIDEERMRLGNMTDEEQVIYNTLMDSEVWIEPFDITKEELFDNKEVALALHEIAAVDELFA